MTETIILSEIPDKNLSGKIAMLELGNSILDMKEEPGGFGAQVEFWVDRTVIEDMRTEVRDKLVESEDDEVVQRGEKLIDRINQWENQLGDLCHMLWDDGHGAGYLDGYAVEKSELIERDRVMAILAGVFSYYNYIPNHDFTISLIEAFGEYVQPNLKNELLEDEVLFDDVNDFIEVDRSGTFGFSFKFSDVVREANDLYQSADDNAYYEWRELTREGEKVKALYDKVFKDLPEDMQEELEDFLGKIEGAREVFYAEVDHLTENLEMERKQCPVKVPEPLFDFTERA